MIIRTSALVRDVPAQDPAYRPPHLHEELLAAALYDAEVSTTEPPQIVGDGGDIRASEAESVRAKACCVERVRLDSRVKQK